MSPADQPTIQSAAITAGDDTFVTIYAPGFELKSVSESHPSFKAIVNLLAQEATRALTGEGTPVDPQEVYDLIDVEATVTKAFERVTDRITVENGVLHLDGDPAHGVLQQQIVDLVTAGEDVTALVNFYEKLLSNPLGNVRDGVFTWMQAQQSQGGLAITPDGDLIGYKATHEMEPDWREGDEPVYVPSRASINRDRVNDVDVPEGKFIEQRPGDVVSMPRSKVLNAPSAACGDGLHIGTYSYAKGFMGASGTVLLVKFSPRAIVSLPDSNSTWKLRVCRYTVLGPCDGPLDAPLYITEDVEADVDDQIVSVSQGEADLYV